MVSWKSGGSYVGYKTCFSFFFFFLLLVGIEKNGEFIDKMCDSVCTAWTKMPLKQFFFFFLHLVIYHTFVFFFFVFFYLSYFCKLIAIFCFIFFTIIIFLRFFTNIESWVLTASMCWYFFILTIGFTVLSGFFFELSQLWTSIFKLLLASKLL